MTTAISKIAKVVDRMANEQPKSATIVRVDHGFVDISLGPGSGVIHHVLVQGNIEQLAPNMTVPIQWEERQGGYLYPVVIATGGEVSTVGSVPLVLVDNETIRSVDGELSVKPGGIGLSQLAFVPSIDGHSHPSELAQAGLQVQTGVLQNVNQDLNITGTGRIEAGGDLFIDGADPTYRLWVGDEDPTQAPFSVQADGTLTAGTVNADVNDIDLDTDGHIGANIAEGPAANGDGFYVDRGGTSNTGRAIIGKWVSGALTKGLHYANEVLTIIAGTINATSVTLTGAISAASATITGAITAAALSLSSYIDINKSIPSPDAPASNYGRFYVDTYERPRCINSFGNDYFLGTFKEALKQDRTYYVRTDGSDSNDGRSNSSLGAFLTIQKAVDTIAGLDLNGYTATASVQAGTYTGAVTLKNVAGYTAPGCLVIQGNQASPSSVLVSVTNANAFNAESVNSAWDLKYMAIKTTTSGNCVRSFYGSTIRVDNIVWDNCAGYHMTAGGSSSIFVIGNQIITGGAAAHMYAWGSSIVCQGKTITFYANCAFTDFAYTQIGGRIVANNNTYNLQTWTVTGRRYYAISNGVIFTLGGANYFPGNTAGATATGGQYV